MALSKRSVVLTSIRTFQTIIGIAFFVAIAAFVYLLWPMQWPHQAGLDNWVGTKYIQRFCDPILSTFAAWARAVGRDWEWPSSSRSYLPLAGAAVIWMVKVLFDNILLRIHRKVGKLMPAPALEGVGDLTLPSELAALEAKGIGLDSERARDHLLKSYRQIEEALKHGKRKQCAFLSVDVVGSTQMKVGEAETAVAATFQAYEEMLRKIFEQFGAWKQAWTPDGVMICFLQIDLAVGAAQRILQSLGEFNTKSNKLKTPFRVRCGLNEGEVPIYEDTKLEKVADRVIDVAGHMQKQGSTNALWLSSEAYQRLADKAGFRGANETVDGLQVYEWSLEPSRERPKPAAAAAAPVGPLAAKREKIGRYQIISELGRGAMGAVYKARDPQIGRTVAIKNILTANLSAGELEDYKQRFFREAQTAGQMAHPGIVTIYDISEDEYGQPYLVMEFIEGTELEKMMEQRRAGKSGPPPTLQQLLSIAIQVADALDYAHKLGVIHRDIKPANILITRDGKAKIADFGIAKRAEGTQMTQAGLLVGTPAFMAPEQFTGTPADSRSDIYSLGVVIYWLLTGRKPFDGAALTEVAYKVVHGTFDPPRKLNATLPVELDSVIARCLAKKPEARYQAAGELARDLEAISALRAAPAAAAPPRAG